MKPKQPTRLNDLLEERESKSQKAKEYEEEGRRGRDGLKETSDILFLSFNVDFNEEGTEDRLKETTDILFLSSNVDFMCVETGKPTII